MPPPLPDFLGILRPALRSLTTMTTQQEQIVVEDSDDGAMALVEYEEAHVQLDNIQHTLKCVTHQLKDIPEKVIAAINQAHSKNDMNNGYLAIVSELGKLKAELGNTVAHLERTERLLQASEREVKILQQENEKLHDIVLNQAGTQKVSDDEIVQHFLKIRQSLQKLARNSSFSLDGELVVLEAIEDNAMAEFYDEANWGHLSVRDRAYRVRAKIFEMLNCNILSNQSFGSSGIDSEGVIENGLQRLENSLKKRKLDHDMIDDWRVATIRCVEECNDGDEETSFATAQRIFNFFAPILSRGFDEASEKRFDSHLIELCQDMYRLSMVMRSSRGGYKCRAVMQKSHRGQKFASIEDWAEAVAVDAGKDNEAGETVAYMLFGALVKYQQGKPMKVLEKAQVVLKREK